MYTFARHSLAGGLAFVFALLLSIPVIPAHSLAQIQSAEGTHPPENAEIGAPAPDFTLRDTNGEAHSLSDFAGKYVVLEWVDFRCPYVGKHYGSGNMQQLQATYTNKGVVWLSVYSASPRHPGYLPPETMEAKNEEIEGNQTALLIDPTGEVGKTYGATNTPHMFVINPDGELIYRGGIDDRPTTDEADVKGAKNYVRAALDASMNGKEVEVKKAPPYGCPVKYAN